MKKQLEALDTLTSIVKKSGISAVMVIHDLNLAAGYSDNLVYAEKGEGPRDRRSVVSVDKGEFGV